MLIVSDSTNTYKSTVISEAPTEPCSSLQRPANTNCPRRSSHHMRPLTCVTTRGYGWFAKRNPRSDQRASGKILQAMWVWQCAHTHSTIHLLTKLKQSTVWCDRNAYRLGCKPPRTAVSFVSPDRCSMALQVGEMPLMLPRKGPAGKHRLASKESSSGFILGCCFTLQSLMLLWLVAGYMRRNECVLVIFELLFCEAKNSEYNSERLHSFR